MRWGKALGIMLELAWGIVYFVASLLATNNELSSAISGFLISSKRRVYGHAGEIIKAWAYGRPGNIAGTRFSMEYGRGKVNYEERILELARENLFWLIIFFSLIRLAMPLI